MPASVFSSHIYHLKLWQVNLFLGGEKKILNLAAINLL